MHVVLNVHPRIEFPVCLAEHAGVIDQGFASHVKADCEHTVLVFHDVEDHVDGNGIAGIWLVSGSGTFYQAGRALRMKAGDVMVFDDRVEHGFGADEICLAVNIPLAAGDAKAMIEHAISALNS